MNHTRAAICGALLASFASGHANGEPSRIVRSLMDEPMSLFDWGVYQTDKRLETFKDFKGLFDIHYMGGSAQYDWDSDRLKVYFRFQGTGTTAECVENLKKGKGALLNFTWSEPEQRSVAASVLASLFSHEGGYKSKSQPKDLGDQLVNITVLEGTVYVAGEKGSYSPKVRCQTTLKSKDVSVVQ